MIKMTLFSTLSKSIFLANVMIFQEALLLPEISRGQLSVRGKKTEMRVYVYACVYEALIDRELCKASIEKKFARPLVALVGLPKVSIEKAICKTPIQEGLHAHMHTYMYISVFFPTDTGMFHKALSRRHFTKPYKERLHTYTYISVFLSYRGWHAS